MEWVGERFFTADGQWIDAATGTCVQVRLECAPAAGFAEWNEQCGRLARLRHPILNSLLDWGVASPHHVFEAYEARGATRAPGVAAESALDHVARFLRASGVSLDPGRSRRLMRPLGHGHDDWLRPVGVTLQLRPALEAIEETLDGAFNTGAVVITVAAPERGSGMRTLKTLAARAARLRGYVPVCARTVNRFPQVITALRGRHVCLLDGPDERPGAERVLGDFLTRFATPPRRHVVVRFARHGRTTPAIPLGPMPIRSLVGMVYADEEHGPPERDLFDAARQADGSPGVLVHTLSLGYQPAHCPMVVHESRADYTSDLPAVAGVPPRNGRVLGSALRAPSRAAVLARAGRPAAAMRVLERGLRVLAGRGRDTEAAVCAMHLGTMALDRGRPDLARTHFAQGSALGRAEACGLTCLVGDGVALTDQGQFAESEAVLRGALSAADVAGHDGIVTAAAAALGRCLFWQERYHEAIGVIAPWREKPCEAPVRARLLAMLARAESRVGRMPAALAAARTAHAVAAAIDEPRIQTSAELALGESLFAAGDATGALAAAARAGRLARAAHLPLFRVRAALLHALVRPGPSARRLLQSLRPGELPSLLALRIEKVLAAETRDTRPEPVREVETLLDLCQRSSDDRTALGAICHAVADRLRSSSLAIVARDDRVLLHHGRGPGTLPALVRETLASGQRVSPQRATEPREAAEPVRYGGEVIAAILCRWPAGTVIDVDDATLVLRAAALSAAAPVRALLDLAVPEQPSAWGDLLGASPGASALRDVVARAARAPFSVLIEGESGSGKELVARAIHRLSARRDRRFCAVNCAALTEDLLEAELFGHTRGAFTGAATERAGLFEEADGGTIFLDEVAELSARAQAKLLRVLQEGEVRRVGENLPRRIDVRVVAATNRTLEQEVAAKRFRADLRFRLDVVRISVPPLRDRAADIPLLAAQFWRDASQRVGSQATLSGEVLAALARYDWPGNVRELQNVIAWIAVHSPKRGRVGVLGLPEHIARSRPAPAATLDAAREEFERRFVRAALATAQGRRSRAADALGISRQGLAKMMRRLRIEAP